MAMTSKSHDELQYEQLNLSLDLGDYQRQLRRELREIADERNVWFITNPLLWLKVHILYPFRNAFHDSRHIKGTKLGAAQELSENMTDAHILANNLGSPDAESTYTKLNSAFNAFEKNNSRKVYATAAGPMPIGKPTFEGAHSRMRELTERFGIWLRDCHAALINARAIDQALADGDTRGEVLTEMGNPPSAVPN